MVQHHFVRCDFFDGDCHVEYHVFPLTCTCFYGEHFLPRFLRFPAGFGLLAFAVRLWLLAVVWPLAFAFEEKAPFVDLSPLSFVQVFLNFAPVLPVLLHQHALVDVVERAPGFFVGHKSLPRNYFATAALVDHANVPHFRVVDASELQAHEFLVVLAVVEEVSALLLPHLYVIAGVKAPPSEAVIFPSPQWKLTLSVHLMMQL